LSPSRWNDTNELESSQHDFVESSAQSFEEPHFGEPLGDPFHDDEGMRPNVPNNQQFERSYMEEQHMGGPQHRMLPFGGPYMGGPPYRMPPFGGPYMGGPYMGGPYMGGPYMGGPYMGGPYMGGPYMGGPYMGGPPFRGSYMGGPPFVGLNIGGPTIVAQMRMTQFRGLQVRPLSTVCNISSFKLNAKALPFVMSTQMGMTNRNAGALVPHGLIEQAMSIEQTKSEQKRISRRHLEKYGYATLVNYLMRRDGNMVILSMICEKRPSGVSITLFELNIFPGDFMRWLRTRNDFSCVKIENEILISMTKKEIPPIKQPFIPLHNTMMPEMEMPETEIPETEMPEMEMPETEMPETEMPETEIPEMEIPEMEMSSMGPYLFDPPNKYTRTTKSIERYAECQSEQHNIESNESEIRRNSLDSLVVSSCDTDNDCIDHNSIDHDIMEVSQDEAEPELVVESIPYVVSTPVDIRFMFNEIVRELYREQNMEQQSAQLEQGPLQQINDVSEDEEDTIVFDPQQYKTCFE
jgi:hypothetical protein